MSTDQGDGDRASNGWTESVGSVGEEAARLLGALHGALTGGEPEGSVADGHAAQDAARGVAEQAAGLVSGLAGLAGQAAESLAASWEEARPTGETADGAEDSPRQCECSYCPLCRTARLLRTTHPEVVEHLTQAASSLLLALQGLMPGAASGSAGAPGRDTGRGFERIDLDDE
ncbi:hypothetical protein [Nocardioides sp. GXZ039]|uniref:hypothetical protein n=1 Tax=Nocardioides sp. GXZ039 TaxID=3136018 RepID=UPI0030F3B800